MKQYKEGFRLLYFTELIWPLQEIIFAYTLNIILMLYDTLLKINAILNVNKWYVLIFRLIMVLLTYA